MALPTTYNINRAIASTIGAYGAPFATHKFTTTLGAATEATLTVPGIATLGNINSSSKAQWMAVFSYEAAKKIYVAVNATAAVPAGNTLAASTSSLNPPGRIVKEGDVISVISGAVGDMSIELYYVQEG
jgi:hypothetical protein